VQLKTKGLLESFPLMPVFVDFKAKKFNRNCLSG
jgi:hypothetical protein